MAVQADNEAMPGTSGYAKPRYDFKGDGTKVPVVQLDGSEPALASSIVTGQVKIATTGQAVQLPSNALVNGIVVKKFSGGTPGTVGGSTVTNTVDGTGNGYIIELGAGASFAVSNSNVIWVNGTAGDIFTFEGN